MSSPKKILLVEDEDSVGKVFLEFFEIYGFQVLWVCNRQEAWTVLQKQEFDLVITDNLMPGGNGFELIAQIREALSPLNKKPIILMSGTGEPKGHKADRFFKKPLKFQALLTVVKELLHTT